MENTTINMNNNEMPYTNREVDEKYKDIQTSLNRIEVQTTKHNGRMSALERWQSFTMGGLAILGLLVLPLLSWSIYTLANLNQIIHNTVDEALSAYDIEK